MQRNANMLKILKKSAFLQILLVSLQKSSPLSVPRKDVCPSRKFCNTLNINRLNSAFHILHRKIITPTQKQKLRKLQSCGLQVAFLPASIINISSSRDRMSQPQTESYTAAKGGIAALTHALAVSLSGRARVNSISPG